MINTKIHSWHKSTVQKQRDSRMSNPKWNTYTAARLPIVGYKWSDEGNGKMGRLYLGSGDLNKEVRQRVKQL